MVDDRKPISTVVPTDWRTRVTVTVPQYAAIIGIARNTAYEAARAGDVATIKVRGRILVSVPALLRQLGM